MTIQTFINIYAFEPVTTVTIKALALAINLKTRLIVSLCGSNSSTNHQPACTLSFRMARLCAVFRALIARSTETLVAITLVAFVNVGACGIHMTSMRIRITLVDIFALITA